MAHTQKPYFVFQRNGRVHLNRRGRQFSRLPAEELCASAVVMLDTPCSEVVWRVLATHSIRQFPLHFPSRASPCAIKFQLDSYLLLKRRHNHKYQQNGRHFTFCPTQPVITHNYLDLCAFLCVKCIRPNFINSGKLQASKNTVTVTC